MFKTVWSQERYQEEYKRFRKSLGEPRHTSMIGSMSWHAKTSEQFHAYLKEEDIGWERDVNDEYTKLRNTSAFQDFLKTAPESISLGDFHNLATKAINEAYGNLSYLDHGFPKLKLGFINNKRAIFLTLIKNFRVIVDSY